MRVLGALLFTRTFALIGVSCISGCYEMSTSLRIALVCRCDGGFRLSSTTIRNRAHTKVGG